MTNYSTHPGMKRTKLTEPRPRTRVGSVQTRSRSSPRPWQPIPTTHGRSWPTSSPGAQGTRRRSRRHLQVRFRCRRLLDLEWAEPYWGFVRGAQLNASPSATKVRPRRRRGKSQTRSPSRLVDQDTGAAWRCTPAVPYDTGAGPVGLGRLTGHRAKPE
jgi:hypothetical protein